MIKDLWGFKDIRDLEKSTADMPESILKEQVVMLGDKTDFTLCGKTSFIKIQNRDIEYSIANIFKVVVPALDNYEKTLLIMYSNPETDYPVAITVNSSYEEDCESFNPQYICNNKEEFEQYIGEILSSESVMKIIQTLYSKAAMLRK